MKIILVRFTADGHTNNSSEMTLKVVAMKNCGQHSVFSFSVKHLQGMNNKHEEMGRIQTVYVIM